MAPGHGPSSASHPTGPAHPVVQMPYRCAACMRPQIAFRLCCPDCGAWNSIESQANRVSAGDSRPVALDEIGPIEWPRRMSNILQLDALLGNGFVPGSSLLLTGTPGAGKSTLVMQILAAMKVSSLYASGEESVQQLKIRANRLKISSPRILLLFETQVRKILAHTEICRPEILVIDSIQTVYTDSSDSAPGGPSQIRKCSYELRRAAQQQGFVLILVGQVTKGGRAAGPKLLEHAVDVVLTLEAEEGRRRCLSASKNRFGSTGERCTLLMEEEGLVFRNQVAGGPAERP